MSYDAFPLQWPDGWPRAKYRDQAAYLVEFETARRELKREIKLMNGSDLVISSNVPIRQDGECYASSAGKNYMDPGVAIYFKRKKEQIGIGCDCWDRVKDNLRALGLTIKAMRQIERCGASDILDRAFTAFKALPPAMSISNPNWWDVLQVLEDSPTALVKKSYRSLATANHPDRDGGDAGAMARINEAWETFKAERGAL